MRQVDGLGGEGWYLHRDRPTDRVDPHHLRERKRDETEERREEEKVTRRPSYKSANGFILFACLDANAIIWKSDGKLQQQSGTFSQPDETSDSNWLI